MATKTRVQVRGTIGKSVKISQSAGLSTDDVNTLIATAIADIPTATVVASSAATGVTSVGLVAGSSDITVSGTSPITATGTFTIDLSATVKTDLGLAVTSIQPGNADLALAATAIQPGNIQNAESAGWNSTSGAIQLSLTVPQDILIPYAATLREVYILTQGGGGSCTVTLTKCAIGSFPGGLTDITGGVSPAIAASSSPYTNTSLSGWTTAFSQNDIVRATLTANSTFTSVKIILRMY
jgi:hypothetical protein